MTGIRNYRFNESSGNAINHGSLGARFNGTYYGTPTRNAPTSGGDISVAFNAGGDYVESLTTSPMSLNGNLTLTAETLFFVPTVGGSASGYAPFLNWGE